MHVYRIISKKHIDISVLYVNMQKSHFNIIISHFNIIISHVTCCSLHLWRQIRQTWKADRMVKSKSTWWYMYIVKHFKNWLFPPEIALLFTGKFCREDQGTVLSKLKVYQWNAKKQSFHFIEKVILSKHICTHRVNYY